MDRAICVALLVDAADVLSFMLTFKHLHIQTINPHKYTLVIIYILFENVIILSYCTLPSLTYNVLQVNL